MAVSHHPFLCCQIRDNVSDLNSIVLAYSTIVRVLSVRVQNLVEPQVGRPIACGRICLSQSHLQNLSVMLRRTFSVKKYLNPYIAGPFRQTIIRRQNDQIQPTTRHVFPDPSGRSAYTISDNGGMDPIITWPSYNDI